MQREIQPRLPTKELPQFSVLLLLFHQHYMTINLSPALHVPYLKNLHSHLYMVRPNLNRHCSVILRFGFLLDFFIFCTYVFDEGFHFL